MAKKKYLYATKMHVYTMLAALVFVPLMMVMAWLRGGPEAPSLSMVLLILALLGFVGWLTWKSYKGELPMMRIEER